MENIEILLRKMAEGTISPSEETFLLKWLKENRDPWSLHLHEQYRLTLHTRKEFIEQKRSEAILKAIHAKIQPVNTDTHVDPFPGRIIRYIGLAASVLMLLTLGWIHFTSKRPKLVPLISLTAENTVTNDRSSLLPIILEDGSTVLLYPHSTLTYKNFQGHEEREVTLTGKAFFEIMRNPEHPFLVHSGEMVTRVLGTSFLIDADETQQHFKVVVKTGKVAVSGKKPGKTLGEISSVTLVDNEEAVFDRSSEEFVAVNTTSLHTITEKILQSPKEYRFFDTPVLEILEILSQDYEVEIETDRDLLSNCSLTTSLRDKPLYDKLRIICEGIGPGTTFSIEHNKVTITTLGCNE